LTGANLLAFHNVHGHRRQPALPVWRSASDDDRLQNTTLAGGGRCTFSRNQGWNRQNPECTRQDRTSGSPGGRACRYTRHFSTM